jgi:amidase
MEKSGPAGNKDPPMRPEGACSLQPKPPMSNGSRMNTTDLPFASIADLTASYRRRTLSPVEVTRALLDRVERLNPALRAWLTVTPEHALAQARQAEADIGRGVFRGPMHGVPIGLKDLCETAGVRTTWGTRVLAGHVPKTDATVVRRLSEAGAITLGKLHMTEGAYSQHHPDYPAPLNPWNPAHWPGNSSSGSGVAVAAGLCFGAIGTDTGGSIRFPSGANGVTGLKPTWGRVSRHGVLPLADSLDHVGPMTRSAADAAAMFSAMAGADPLDLTSLDAPVPDYVAGLSGGIRGLRVGIDPAWCHEVNDATTSAVLDEALRVLCELGAERVEVRIPDTAIAMAQGWTRLCAVEAAVAHHATWPSRASDYGQALNTLIELGHKTTAVEVMAIQQCRLVFQGALRRLFDGIDLLLVPVQPFANPSIDWLAENRKRPGGVDALLRFTAPFDMSGSPTITLPGGATADGMPVGFQLVGRHLDEALLLRAGHAFQQATDWHLRHPPV